MTNTNELTDKVILFFACFCIYLVQPIFEVSVVPIIIIVTISSLLSYLEQDKLRFILYLVYLVLCLLIPPLILFMPLYLYDLYGRRFQVLMFMTILPMILNWDKMNLMVLGTISAIIFIGLWLKYRTMKLFEMKNKYNQLSDNARELSNQLKTQNKEISDKMENDINLATLKERNRIAREIHDNVGHQLSSAILQIGAILAVNKDENLKNSLTLANNTLSQAMNCIRDSVHDLHDQSVDLHMQMEALLVRFSFCEVIFRDQLTTKPDKKLRLAFIAITKEALSNIIKHSNAKEVNILLREHPAFYQLIIRDNGTVKFAPKEEGMGLMNMSDRIYAFNGNINFRHENGFEIFISVPKGECI